MSTQKVHGPPPLRRRLLDLLGVTSAAAALSVGWVGCGDDAVRAPITEPDAVADVIDDAAADVTPPDDVAPDGPPAFAPPPAEPHPAMDFITWRDDELFTLSNIQIDSVTRQPLFLADPLTATSGLESVSHLAACSAGFLSDTVQGAAAAGRVTSADRERVVMVHTTVANAQNLQIRFGNGLRPPECLAADGGPGFSLGPSTIVGIPSTPALAPAPTVGDQLLPAIFDTDVTDLDRREDAQGALRDEVIVAYATPGASATQHSVTVAVVDWTDVTGTGSNVYPTVQTASGSRPLDLNAIGASDQPVPTVPLAVAAGDFTGDGRPEFAVAYLSSPTQITVDLFAYTTTVDGATITHTLGRIGTTSLSATSSAVATNASKGFTPQQWSRGFDAVAGDFDGDGRDELIVGAVARGTATSDTSPAAAIDLKVIDLGEGLVADTRGTLFGVAYGTATTVIASEPLGLQLEAGLMQFDDATGNVGLMQLVMAHGERGGRVPVTTLALADDLALTTLGSNLIARTTQQGIFSLAVGGLRGLRTATGDPADLLDSVALGLWDASGYRLWLFRPDDTTGVPSGGSVTNLNSVPIPTSVVSRAVLPMVAFDYEGDSVNLGAPVHLIIENVTQTQAIIQDPPKHAYWDQTLNRVVTINRLPDTFAQLSSTDVETFSASTTNQSDFTIGGSVAVSASASAQSPGFLVDASVSTSISQTLGYDYSQHEETFNSGVATRRYETIYTTESDDKITYMRQTIDVWRYRVYGADLIGDDGQPIEGNPFIEIVVPRNTPVPAVVGGTSVSSWYQPLHEPGNVLSYPLTLANADGDLIPADLGPVRVPCAAAGPDCVADDAGLLWREVVETLATLTGAIDGTTTEVLVQMETTTGTGQRVQHTNKLTSSTDISSTVKVSVADLASVSASTEVELHESGSWGDLTNTETTTSQTQGVRLKLGSIAATRGYDFESVLYVTQDGTLKLQFATDPLGNDTGRFFWETTYGGGPDPALNLPTRFNPVYNVNNIVNDWTPNLEATRNKMRGFFVRQSAPDPITGEHPLLGRAISVGETVRLEARVHNFTVALDGAVTNLAVQFEAVPVDNRGVPIGSRTVLGRTTVPRVDPRQIGLAVFDWNTDDPAFRGVAGTSQRWRVFVVLDPDNAIANEIYESEDPDPTQRPFCQGGVCVDPGQNNEGWEEVVMATPIAGAPLLPNPTYGLVADALAAIGPDGELVHRTAEVLWGQPIDLHILVQAERAGLGTRPVYFYDGDPDQGGQLLGESEVLIGDLQGASARFRWTPLTEGTHTLFARIEPHDEDEVTENLAILEVVVVRP